MQFSLVSLVAALAATASAAYYPRQLNGTAAIAPYPTGTGSPNTPVSFMPSGTAAPSGPSALPPFTGAAAVPTHMAGSALGFIVAGGVALML